MAMLCMINAARSSNIIFMTLHDVKQATTDDEYVNARIIRSTRYKTSMLYGVKILALYEATYNHLMTYVSTLRPLLVNDEDRKDEFRFLFHSSSLLKENTVSFICLLSVAKSNTSALLPSQQISIV